MQENIEDIIKTAVLAPSGDNAQPWRFEVKQNVVEIINVPEKDQSLYNLNQQASYVAHGCLIENIKLISSARNFITNIETFPEKNDVNLVARIYFTPHVSQKNELHTYIAQRATNRKKYTSKLISTEIQKAFVECQDENNGIEVFLAEGEDKDLLAAASSKNEKIVLENAKLHNFLFTHITWSDSEDKQNPGFYIKTLELNFLQNVAFKLFKSWGILNFFNKVHVADIVSTDNEKLYKKSALIGAIVMKENSARSFLQSGMVLQHIWLTATKYKIALQPLTGISFLMQRIIKKNKDTLSKKHTDLIENSYKMIQNIYNTEKHVAFLFRAGYADSPSAQTRRTEPEIIWKD